MRIALYHGYELKGSGSNEYNRYLACALASAGHDVHMLCREPDADRIEVVRAVWTWNTAGEGEERFTRDVPSGYTVHQLPHGLVRPVYLTDKLRDGVVKAFTQLTDGELAAYHELNVTVVRAIVATVKPDILMANHLVWQPSVAAEVDVPFVVFPHGSAIEYTVKADPRYEEAAGRALERACGIITGSREVLDRILRLYPGRGFENKACLVGVGVDTSLFLPVERAERPGSIARLRGPFSGKTAAQSNALRASLDAGDFDALHTFFGTYDQSSPDADLETKLARVPWIDGRVLLFVGALTAGKGLQSVLAALPRVLAARPDTHLLVVGSGAYREVLEALVHAIATGNQALFDHLAKNGFTLDRSELTGGWRDIEGIVPHEPRLANHVHFLGRIDHALLRYLFPCADLAVFPSVLPEAYPLVLMEAFANGVLPVVSDFTGFREGLDQIEPLLGSLWVDRMRLPVSPEGRVEGIASRLVALLEDTSITSIGPRLREIAVERFDWSVRASQIVDAYRAFLAM